MLENMKNINWAIFGVLALILSSCASAPKNPNEYIDFLGESHVTFFQNESGKKFLLIDLNYSSSKKDKVADMKIIISQGGNKFEKSFDLVNSGYMISKDSLNSSDFQIVEFPESMNFIESWKYHLNYKFKETEFNNYGVVAKAKSTLKLYPNQDKNGFGMYAVRIAKKPDDEYIPSAETFRIEISDLKNRVLWNSREGNNYTQVVKQVEPEEVSKYHYYNIEIPNNGNIKPISTGMYNVSLMIPAKKTPYSYNFTCYLEEGLWIPKN